MQQKIYQLLSKFDRTLENYTAITDNKNEDHSFIKDEDKRSGDIL